MLRVPARLKQWLLGSALAALLAVFAWFTVLPAQNHLTHGFMAYYAAGHIIGAGHDAFELYDERGFMRQVDELSHGQVIDPYLGNTPALAVAWMPLARLPVEHARTLWIWLGVVWIALVIALVVAEWPPSDRLSMVVLLVFLLTLSSPAREQAMLGQMYACVLLLHVLGWRAWQRGNDALAGIMLGMTMMLKLSGWPIGVLWLLKRRWKAVIWSMATGLVIVAATLPWTGLAVWREAVFVQIPASIGMDFVKLSAYQTVSGLWQHLFVFDAVYNPQPAADSRLLATAGTLLTMGVAIVAMLRPGLSPRVQFAAALVLTVVLSPMAEQYHYVLVLVPLAMLLWHAHVTGSRALLALLVLATVLLVAPIPYKQYSAGWWALLDYPRLAAGAMIFCALLRVRRLSDGQPDEAHADERD